MSTNSMHDLCVYSADGGITHCGLKRHSHFYLTHTFTEAQAQFQEPYLRLDYSVECEHCGYLKQMAPKLSEHQVQRLLHDQGWRLIEDENRCPTCATQEEHTPDEGEPHPVTECESRGCVKLRKER